MLLKYPGSKFSCRELLIDYAPFEFDEFRSPFCGNEPLLWSLPTDLPRWVNDLDEMIYRYWLGLRDDSTFIRRFQELRTEGFNSIDDMIRVFERCIEQVRLDKDPAAYLYVRRLAMKQMAGFHRPNFASFGYKFAADWSSLRAMSFDTMRRARDIAQGVKITCVDFAEVLRAPVRKGCCWSLLDPPYYVSDHGMHIYEKCFNFDMRERLKTEVLKLNPDRHKVMITVEDSEYSHNEYYLDSRFNVLYRYYVSHMTTDDDDKCRTKRDLIVTNYDL